tara:strand:- start:23 stop:568 length:546 start_codon:yes stop_codon:yes gene_type:complete
MADVAHKKIAIEHWQSLRNERERRSAFRRKSTWVIHAPGGTAVWYAAVLSNLTRNYTAGAATTLDIVHGVLREGLDRSAFELLKEVVEIANEELGRVIHIPMRTLARRTTFKPDESERLFRVASVFQKTLEVFDDLDKARRWFLTPKRVLGERAPLEHCGTELGAEEVRQLLGRIEHGVFT